MTDRLSEIKKRYDNHEYFNLSAPVSEQFGWLISEVERMRKGLKRIEMGDMCDECRADKLHIKLCDGEFVHSCRMAIARDTLMEAK